jgi:hypothetical protein
MQVSDNFERDTYEPFPVDLGREVDRQVKRWIQVLEGIARR